LSGFHLFDAFYSGDEGPYILEAALSQLRGDMHMELSAAEVVTERGRWVQNQATISYQFPSQLEAGRTANKLEVINIYGENEFERPMEEKAFPSGDRLKTALQELVREVVPPILATHGVAVQR